ncbi:MAG: hypothetical protein AB7N76_28120 [Planctomycetota bacterium]
MTRTPRRRRAATAALCALLALPGCDLARWGPGAGDRDYCGASEAWEVPLGWLSLPGAFTLDLSLSIVLTVLNPINWLLSSVDSGFVVWAFPLTSSALTLANPSCNLDWAWPAPEGMTGLSFGHDDEDDEDEAERQEREEEERRRAEHEALERRASAPRPQVQPAVPQGSDPLGGAAHQHRARPRDR